MGGWSSFYLLFAAIGWVKSVRYHCCRVGGVKQKVTAMRWEDWREDRLGEGERRTRDS
jgi:hypothetical protein